MYILKIIEEDRTILPELADAHPAVVIGGLLVMIWIYYAYTKVQKKLKKGQETE